MMTDLDEPGSPRIILASRQVEKKTVNAGKKLIKEHIHTQMV